MAVDVVEAEEEDMVAATGMITVAILILVAITIQGTSKHLCLDFYALHFLLARRLFSP